jgi:hypothetical protein
MQLDGFKLVFTPDAGGANITLEYGYSCAGGTKTTTNITKKVTKVTNVGSRFTAGFIFHHSDGTTT